MPGGFAARADTLGDVLSHGDPCGKTLVALGRLRLVGKAGQWWKRVFGVPTRARAETLLRKQGVFLIPDSHRLYLRDNSMSAVVHRLLSSDEGGPFLSRLREFASSLPHRATGRSKTKSLRIVTEGFAKLGRVAHAREPDCLDLTLMLFLVPLWGLSDKTFQDVVGGRESSIFSLYAYDGPLEVEWLWLKSLLCTFYAFFADDNPAIRDARRKAEAGRLPPLSFFEMQRDLFGETRERPAVTAATATANASRAPKRRQKWLRRRRLRRRRRRRRGTERKEVTKAPCTSSDRL